MQAKRKTLSNEDLFIRDFSRINTDKTIADKIRAVVSWNLNWDELLEFAKNKAVMPILFKGLSEIRADFVIPKNIWDEMESYYYTVAARNTLLYDKLKGILRYFNNAGIEVILLKGMALAQTVYPDIAMRPMYDIDILIHKKDFCAVEDCLRRLGYINSSFYPEDFYKDDMMVDVHWELMNITRVESRKKSSKIELDEIWRNSHSIDIDGQPVRVLSPEHCLIELCLHFALHHGLSGLIWAIDIARVIGYHKNDFKWIKFVEDTIRYKIPKTVYYALFYVSRILGQEIPQNVLDNLKPQKQGMIEKKIFNSVLSGVSFPNIRFFFTLIAIEGIRNKIVFLREIIFPSVRVLSAKYNIISKKHIPKYYLKHFMAIFSSLFRLGCPQK